MRGEIIRIVVERRLKVKAVGAEVNVGAFRVQGLGFIYGFRVHKYRLGFRVHKYRLS